MASHAAAAQDGGAVTQLTHFVEFVADVENAAALFGELAQRLKQLAHSLRREHRGWLIHDQKLGVLQQATNDFHPLTLTHRQGVH